MQKVPLFLDFIKENVATRTTFRVGTQDFETICSCSDEVKSILSKIGTSNDEQLVRVADTLKNLKKAVNQAYLDSDKLEESPFLNN